MKYAVKVRFVYSDIVHVVASHEKEAMAFAIEECKEEYDCLLDVEINEE